MYFREIPFAGLAALTVPRPIAPPGAGGVPAPPTIPRVGMEVTKNFETTSPDNCCAACPANLGVGVNNTGQNAMEIERRLNGHSPGFEYAINRTRRLSIWERLGGAWRRIDAEPMGTPSNPSSQNLCLKPVGDRIFEVARAGFAIQLPAPNGLVIQGPSGGVSSPAATDIVLRASFAEWVIARNKSLGVDWTTISPGPFLFWHTVNWLTRDATGQWVLDTARSKIDLGELSARELNSPPGP